MGPTKKLSEKLKDYTLRKDDLKIDQWHFTFSEGYIAKRGLDNNKLGGPYLSPETHETCNGAAYIRWGDKSISKIMLNVEYLENLDSAIKEWKTVSYQDPDAPEVIEPLSMPKDLKLKDDKIIELVKGDKKYLFGILNFYNKKLEKRSYSKTIKADATAGYAYNFIMNSKGLNMGWEETFMKTSASINDIVGDGFGKRRFLTEKDFNRIIKEIDRYMVHSKNIVSVNPGEMPIIFTPSVLDELLGHYMVHGLLEGSAVTNNRTIFSIEDFKTKRQVFDKRINLVMDGLKEYSLATQSCSSEGVPATKQYIIADCMLITPIFDRKYAKKTGMQPTSTGEIYLEVEPKVPYKKMIRDIDYGIIIYSILGGHTLEKVTGEYSTSVDQGLLIESGKIKGKIGKVGENKSVSIKGNFFEDLRNENTKFAEYREDELAMMTKAKITV